MQIKKRAEREKKRRESRLKGPGKSDFRKLVKVARSNAGKGSKCKSRD